MERVLVLYATQEGQTQKVASHLGRALSARGVEVETRELGDATLDLADYEGVLLAASVHVGGFPPDLVAFVRDHREALEDRHAAFLPVSLSKAVAESVTSPPERRSEGRADLAKAVALFLQETGWQPAEVHEVAGALPYTRLGFFKRLLLRGIAGQTGLPTDTSRDHEFTDWVDLDTFADHYERVLRGTALS